MGELLQLEINILLITKLHLGDHKIEIKNGFLHLLNITVYITNKY